MAGAGSSKEADAVIAALGLQPHPEGGHYRETYRSPAEPGDRAAVSQIHFLLQAGEVSAWHRIDATEIWQAAAGAPLELVIAVPGAPVRTVIVGSDVLGGQEPHAVVPAGAWQSATSLGAWSLVGCTVAPAFLFDRFEMAPAGWSPPTGDNGKSA